MGVLKQTSRVSLKVFQMTAKLSKSKIFQILTFLATSLKTILKPIVFLLGWVCVLFKIKILISIDRGGRGSKILGYIRTFDDISELNFVLLRRRRKFEDKMTLSMCLKLRFLSLKRDRLETFTSCFLI